MRWIIAILILPFTLQLSAQEDVKEGVEKLDLFLQSLSKRYVDTVETEALVENAITSMLSELDPHSVYMNAKTYERLNEPLKGAFVGIGIRYRTIADTLTIVEVFDDSPAKRAGLTIGDQFIAIDGDTVAGKSLADNEITDKIRGEERSDIKISIFRQKTNERVIATLQRDEVPMKSIEVAHMISKDAGYIKLDRFSATSYAEFKRELNALNDEGMQNLVLDLRGNSGGYLHIAIKIADEFLNERKLVVYTEGTHQSRKDLYSTSGGRFTEGKLIVMMDEGSASASEILAGAVQDWDRGLIIGRRSYGKGLVQRTVEFEDGSAMRLTVSRYYTPTGRSIQKPYAEGHDDYRNDIENRWASGELFFEDSIKVNEEYIFHTPANRPVYGGGGIIPDHFIPKDTMLGGSMTRELLEAGLIQGYAMSYLFSGKEEMEGSYSDQKKFRDRFEVTEVMMNEMFIYASNRNPDLSDERYEESAEAIGHYFKANVGRFLFDMNAYYYCLSEKDEYIMSALYEFDNNTFEELGLK